MDKSLREKLMTIQSEKLVDLIFDLAGESDVSWSKVERLVSKPKDNSKRFLRRLNEIRNRGGYIPWKYSSEFADELSDILADIENGADTPEEGFDLICEFYKSDASIFEQSDDSSGHIGDVFRGTASGLFVKFASQISDKKMIIHKMLELLKDDGYGVRDELICHTGRFLAESDIRYLFKFIEEGALNKNGGFSSWKLESLAKQLLDAPLFEKLVRQSSQSPNSKRLVDIAEVYFLAGDLSKAQQILDSIKDEDSFGKFEQENLQKKIYEKLGKTEDLFKIVYKAFHTHYSEYTLRDLVQVAGENRRAEFIKEATEKILAKAKWDSSDAEFLVHVNDFESLEKIVLKFRSSLLSGVSYSSVSIADYLVDTGKYLASIILYRGLIAETLKKSKSKYYHHAVNYLHIMDQISHEIEFWDGIDNHVFYLAGLKKTHSLKKALWSMYDK